METGLIGHHVTPTEGAKATPPMSWITISKSLIPGIGRWDLVIYFEIVAEQIVNDTTYCCAMIGQRIEMLMFCFTAANIRRLILFLHITCSIDLKHL